ncbi:MAG TPA: hypothetical protein VI670_12835 [Thermoanaerobaculia bacterium]|jgi:hypothetical protein
MTNEDKAARAAALMNEAVDVMLRARQAPHSPVNQYAPPKLRRELRRHAARLREGKAEPRYKNLYTAEELADIYERTVRRDEMVEKTRRDLRRIAPELERLVEENAPGVRAAVGAVIMEAQRLADENGPGSEAEERHRILQFWGCLGRYDHSDRRRGRPPVPPRLRLALDSSVEARYRMSAVEVLPSPPSSGETVVMIPPDGSDYGRGRVFLRIGLGEWSWIGSFARGHKGPSITRMMPDDRHLFVSAAGAGYIIDAKSRTLVKTLGTDVVGVTENEPLTLFVVNHDDVRLEAFGKSGRLWKTGPISAGGFRGLALTDDAIVGETRAPCGCGWVGLVVSLATGIAWIADEP